MASAFVGFLSGLPPRQIDRLYASPWACLAVLRALPPLAKHYAMRLLYVDAHVPLSELHAWVKQGSMEKHRVSIDHMRRLRVLVAGGGSGGGDANGAGGGGGGGGGGSRHGGGGGGNANAAHDDGGGTVRLSPRFQRGLRLMLERSFEPGTTTTEGGGGTGGGADDRLVGETPSACPFVPRIPHHP